MNEVTFEHTDTLNAPGYVASVTVGIKAVSPNRVTGENRFKRSRRVKAARQGVHWALKQISKPSFPCVILMTRIAPSTNGLDSHDNLQGSMKPHVDGVADWLGIRDDDKRVTWKYGQERGIDYGVRITVQADA